MSSGHSPGDFCTGFCSCGDLFSETDNELSMQHAYPVHQEISDEILPMHYGRTFTRERKKSVKPAQLSSIRDLTQLNVSLIFMFAYLLYIHIYTMHCYYIALLLLLLLNKQHSTQPSRDSSQKKTSWPNFSDQSHDYIDRILRLISVKHWHFIKGKFHGTIDEVALANKKTHELFSLMN